MKPGETLRHVETIENLPFVDHNGVVKDPVQSRWSAASGLRDVSWLAIVACFAILLIGLQVAAQGAWGFHRDEFLYLAMARRIAWGYWSNPPLIGAVAWIVNHATDTSLFSVRLFPLGASIVTMLLTAAMARDLGGKGTATVMACIPFVVSPGLVRPGGMFQPVVFDILLWTAMAWIVVRYLRTSDRRWLVGLGIVAGIGFLNKYSIVFFALALLVAVLFSPHRRAILSPHALIALVIAGLLALPNVLWQAGSGWPVVTHMRDLAATQLVNVDRLGFLLEQILIHFPVVLFWMVGLLWLFNRRGRKYRVVGVTFVLVVLLLLLLRGKAYYTLGAYPMLFAAGAVWIEESHRAIRWVLGLLAIVVGIALSPFSAAYLPVDSMIRYGETFVEWTGIEGPLRWETGVVHELPQDYADMLGWEEMAEIAVRAFDEAGSPARTAVFAENYGEAGAVEHYGRSRGIDQVFSFADSYLLWAPESVDPGLRSFVYIAEEESLNFDHMFEFVRPIGRVETRYARERGTTVFLLQTPDSTFFDFYASELARSKGRLLKAE